MALERRTFMVSLAGTLVSRGVPAFAAPSANIFDVAVLIGIADDAETRARAKGFQQGLEKEGWIPGQNLRLHYRYAEGDRARMRQLASELVALKPDCILGHSTPVVTELMKVTKSIPIVFVMISDPIASGFVKSMARPGGNMTGFTILQPTITGKYLELLREMMPQLNRAAIMYNPQSVPAAGAFFVKPFMESAAAFKVKPIVAEVHSPTEIGRAIADLGAEPGSCLLTVPDNFLTAHRDLVISLTEKFRIPAVYPYRYFAEAGGLLSYGVDSVNMFVRATDYVSRILRGAKPADLPVQAPTKFELVINMRTARALGLSVSRVMLAGADGLIE